MRGPLRIAVKIYPSFVESIYLSLCKDFLQCYNHRLKTHISKNTKFNLPSLKGLPDRASTRVAVARSSGLRSWKLILNPCPWRLRASPSLFLLLSDCTRSLQKKETHVNLEHKNFMNETRLFSTNTIRLNLVRV